MSLVGNFTSNYDKSALGVGAMRQDDDDQAAVVLGEVLTPLPEPTYEEAGYQGETSHEHEAGQGSSGSSSGTAVNEEAGDAAAREKVHGLAREMSRRSSVHQGEGGEGLQIEKDSEFDPYSDKFNLDKWIKKMVSVTSRDPENYPARTAGVAFSNLNVHGFGSDTGYQQTVGTFPLAVIGGIRQLFGKTQRKVDILRGFDGLLEAGEMLVVLGPPGSGCSTLLKTLAGETHGIYVDDASEINYQGISPKQMAKNFTGEAIYTAEQDVHFPSLVVGDTLAFAAEARAHKIPPPGFTRREFSIHMRDVIMAILGISHTLNTKVGNEYVRGVSGGERKRVTIAEAMLAGSPLTIWDNSTRGLDAANAIEFCKTLKTSCTYAGSTALVAIYQSPQSAYNFFDKVIVLYEGYQIYFGPAGAAKAFFTDMGFECPEQQSVPDFLTSLTSPNERVPKKGFEHSVPHTPVEFNQRWKESETYAKLMRDIEEYNTKRFPYDGAQYEQFLTSRRAQQSKNARASSPYTLTYGEQVKLCLRRGFWRLKADPSLTISQLVGNNAMAFIVSSVFYNLPDDTSSFFNRGGLLFFSVLLNAFGSALEILTLYAQRPIVEKHQRYAFYHPSAEAFASMLADMPYKIVNAIIFNTIIYFMSNLRREAGPFFFFLLVSFLATLTMSGFFRSVASLSRTLVQALTPAAGLLLGLILYTGFVLPVPYMLGWISWFRYLDPIFYAFESLMVNEFHDREFACVSFVPTGPAYAGVSADQYVCSSVGSTVGSAFVNGDAYIESAYGYNHSHKWRNVGVIFAFVMGLNALYIVATEIVKGKKSKGEIIIFPKNRQPSRSPSDVEGQGGAAVTGSTSRGITKDEVAIQKQTAIFHWSDVCYDVQIKKENRRILDHVDGWVKPGTLTALMGVSGAGKTTLLDVLATRVTMGVVSGEMLVDGTQRDDSFQRSTGYCQQQDVHLSTSTVREALEFSALLRQPRDVPRADKLAYVDEVLVLLEMEAYQHAVVGELGEGLNVEQRKRLTIGVELAAKPGLLLFLDEPTSGLDSQTSWNILNLLEKLSKHGQAVLCTIHQPSAMLFERFDRLLFLQKGGKTVFFNEVGRGSANLISYFERNGAPKYPAGQNPAEWMLEVIGAAPGSHTDIDWHKTWMKSTERAEVRQELARLKADRPSEAGSKEKDANAYKEFAAPLFPQYMAVQKRVFQQLWRTPDYIFSKIALVAIVGLFIGFSLFKSPKSQQGIQNQLFSIFLLFTVFGQMVQQIMPHFVTQRAIYEVRERPSKTYSWKVFMLANIIVELPWNTLAAVVLFFTWYYPIGLYTNAEPSDSVNLRGFQMFLLVCAFMWFTSTFATMVIAAIPTAETGGNIANLAFSMCLVFCGVLVGKDQLGWWIWMYWLSPFHYFVEAMLTTGLARSTVTCADNEYLTFNAPAGQTCGTYMSPYIAEQGGYLLDDSATACQFCTTESTDVVLASYDMSYGNAWRDFGIVMGFCVFNLIVALALYYWVRVPKKAKESKKVGKAKDATKASEKSEKATA